MRVHRRTLGGQERFYWQHGDVLTVRSPRGELLGRIPIPDANVHTSTSPHCRRCDGADRIRERLHLFPWCASSTVSIGWSFRTSKRKARTGSGARTVVRLTCGRTRRAGAIHSETDRHSQHGDHDVGAARPVPARPQVSPRVSGLRRKKRTLEARPHFAQLVDTLTVADSPAAAPTPMPRLRKSILESQIEVSISDREGWNVNKTFLALLVATFAPLTAHDTPLRFEVARQSPVDPADRGSAPDGFSAGRRHAYAHDGDRLLLRRSAREVRDESQAGADCRCAIVVGST